MTQAGSIYGEALFSLAQEEGLDQTVLEELQVLDAAFTQEPEFIRLLSAPNLSKEERCRILDDSFRGEVHAYVLNFLKLLTEKGYIRHFSHCCTAFREQYDRAHGILRVTAVSAVPLTDDQSSRLCEKLRKLTDKSVALTNKVDAACVGGIRLDYDGKRLDGTVSHRLETMRSLLKNTVL